MRKEKASAMNHTEQIGPFRLSWRDGVFPLSTDSVLLSYFATLRPRFRVCDLGCGAGAIPLLLLLRRGDLTVDGVELQPEAAKAARANVLENRLEASVRIYQEDFREANRFLTPGWYDLVVSNPPYFLPGSGKTSPSIGKARARAELCCSLPELCASSRFLLRQRGRFALSFRPDRLSGLFSALSQAGFAPKRLRFVHHRADKPPALVLLESIRGGNPGLDCLPPLLLRREGGGESMELSEIYQGLFRTRGR